MPATLTQLRAAMPAGGMFAGREWLASPEPFPLPAALWREIESLGHRLHVFLRACNDLYYQSHKGKQPAWIAALREIALTHLQGWDTQAPVDETALKAQRDRALAMGASG